MEKTSSGRVRKQLEALVRDLNHHMRCYHVEDKPEISDAEFDRRYRRLEALEAKTGLQLPDSPTRRVGAAPAEGFEPAPHRVPMLSLSNAMNEAELRAWDERIRRQLDRDEAVALVVEPKLDGVGVELVYQDGAFLLGATRGDGAVGEDVSANLKMLLSVPLQLAGPEAQCHGRVSVRGEVLLPLRAFERLNRLRRGRELEPFANPRNAAAGALRMLHDVDIERLRALEFRAYTAAEGLPKEVTRQSEILERLKDWGFLVSPETALCKNLKTAIARHQKLLARREKLPMEIDGTVLKVDALALQRDLGVLARVPRWAIAFKFPPHQEHTVVEDIFTSVGRSGALTPVARLAPIALGGVTVSSASLHNQDEVTRKDVRIGDTVVVQRAGDVIPQIVSVVKGKRRRKARWKLPKRCPACGAAVQREEGEAVVRCPAAACPAKLRNRLLHVASRAALDVDGLGEKIVDQLLEQKKIKSLPDLFELRKEDLLELERMGEKSAANLLTSLKRARKTTLPRLLIALGIPEVGAGVAEVLAAHFGDMDALMAASEEELLAVNGVGEVIARHIIVHFAEPANREELGRLRKLGVRWPTQAPVATAAASEGPLADKVFVLTGTLPTLSRAEARALIEARGGQVKGAVSKKTHYVVAGDAAGSKLRRAAEFEIKVLDEAALQALLENPPTRDED